MLELSHLGRKFHLRQHSRDIAHPRPEASTPSLPFGPLRNGMIASGPASPINPKRPAPPLAYLNNVG